MIVITGAAGFIGSVVVARLNAEGYRDVVLADDFTRPDKAPNWQEKAYTVTVPRQELEAWLAANSTYIQAILHLGARTDTTEQSRPVFEELNLNYSRMLWNWCVQHQVPLIYASSAATYGDGHLGFADTPPNAHQLQPLNPYAWSKNEFDKFVLDEAAAGRQPFFWAGLKFFNVYGPNEYHKGRMASVPFHAFGQIRKEGHLRLFRSHRADYADGEQRRDFIYVQDVASVILWLLQERPRSGLFNLGSGRARSFNDLAHAIFAAMNLPPDIRYMDMPEDIRNSYQYFTEADMHSLVTSGYPHPFTSIEDGIADYVRQYLEPGRYC
ncbi:MAG: ADP-glyceromanno-heptose 6-epimerase [Bacteroidetes bacterium]|nr:ADP-glyceromanno-heptose 6-epimerase [Bacteroidota bacterium]